MANYTKTTDFEVKDSLPSGDPGKIIKGTEFEAEFDAISTSIATKADQAGPTFTGTATFGDVNVTGSFTSLGIDDNATSTAITIDATNDVAITNGLTVDGTTLVVDDVNNRVGVGTATPAYTFEVSAATGFASVTSTTSGVASRFALFNATDNLYAELGNDGSDLIFKPQGAERMRIDASGNVGIGTNAPLNKLVVSEGTGQHGIELVPGTLSYIQAYDRATSDYGDLKIDAQTVAFGTDNGTERMRIDASGNVGIGRTNPLSKLEVLGKVAEANRPTYKGTICIADYGNSTSIDGGLEFHSNSNLAGYGSLIFPMTDGSFGFATRTNSATWSERMRIDTSGRLLVGKSVADGVTSAGFEANPLGVTYTSYNGANPCAYFNRGSNGLGLQFYVGTVDAGGITFTQNSTPAFAAASDERLKDNITDHESELANVMALRPVRWDWKANDNSGEGFIAQEIQETAWADLVSEGDDGMLQVSGLGTVETRLIKAMQEQQAMIEELKAEVEALKNA